MARTPLAQALQRAAAEAAASHQGRRLARRDALKLGGVLGLATAAAAMPFQPGGAKPAPGPTRQIAIVGGGLAGLACAYELKQAGQAVTVFEASDRVGGRSWTLRGAFADNQLVERGGQLIDQSHTAIRQLAGRLGLQTDNLLQAEPNGSEPLYYFDGQPYSYGQATDDLNAVYQKLHGDLSAAGYPTLYNSFTPRGRQLDQMSIVEWINQTVPGGMGSKLGQLLEVAYTIEYGADANQQSALNLLYLLGFSGQGQLRIFGPSNEKYAIRGGCDQLPTRLAAPLQGQIELGQQLVAVRQGGGTVTLTLKQGSRTRTVTLDKVVLALPFSILRSSVDFSGAGFRPLKQTAIRELGMGTNSKLHLQFTDRHWEGLGCNGETFADTGYQNTWDESRAQGGRSGILVNYTGGTVGAGFGSGTPTKRAQQLLAQLEPLLPGITAKWNGRATVDFWLGNPWSKGSYSFWKVGQYTRFAGVEGEPEGNVHFAGEHTSVNSQGYLNGAVETGQRAAQELLSA
jgi:monoamine oxidase